MTENESELIQELGRIESQLYTLKARRQEILNELPPTEDTHCVLCGAELSNYLEWHTGCCDACAEVSL